MIHSTRMVLLILTESYKEPFPIKPQDISSYAMLHGRVWLYNVTHFVAHYPGWNGVLLYKNIEFAHMIVRLMGGRGRSGKIEMHVVI